MKPHTEGFRVFSHRGPICELRPPKTSLSGPRPRKPAARRRGLSRLWIGFSLTVLGAFIAGLALLS